MNKPSFNHEITERQAEVAKEELSALFYSIKGHSRASLCKNPKYWHNTTQDALQHLHRPSLSALFELDAYLKLVREEYHGSWHPWVDRIMDNLGYGYVSHKDMSFVEQLNEDIHEHADRIAKYRTLSPEQRKLWLEANPTLGMSLSDELSDNDVIRMMILDSFCAENAEYFLGERYESNTLLREFAEYRCQAFFEQPKESAT